MTISSKIFAAALIATALVPFASQAGTVTTTTTTTREHYIYKNANTTPVSGVYVAGQVGYNHSTDSDLQDAAVFAGAVGYRINPNFRVEGEVSYRKNDSDISGIDGDTKGINYMVNGWYDFANATRFTPYVGGGIGWVTADLDINVPSLGLRLEEEDSAFVYQLGGGVAYEITRNVALTTDYRFIDTSNFSDFGGDYKAHEIRGGVRYSF